MIICKVKFKALEFQVKPFAYWKTKVKHEGLIDNYYSIINIVNLIY